ncbi:hypothetical protein [Caballeronia sp. HLA56]
MFDDRAATERTERDRARAAACRLGAEGVPISAVSPTRRHPSPKVRLFIGRLVDAWQPKPPRERELR